MDSRLGSSTQSSQYLDWEEAIKIINKYFQVANKYFKTGQYFQALENYTEAADIYSRARTPSIKVRANILYKLAICKIELRDIIELKGNYYNEVKSHLDELLVICSFNICNHAKTHSVPVKLSGNLVESPGLEKYEASEFLYKAGKIFKCLNEDDNAQECFIKALNLLDCQYTGVASLFSQRGIYLPIFKIDFELTKLVLERGRQDKAITALEKGIKVLQSIIDNMVIAIHNQKYRKLHGKLFTLLTQIAPRHPLVEPSIYAAPVTLFPAKKHSPIPSPENELIAEISSSDTSLPESNISDKDRAEIADSGISMCRLC